MSADRMESKQRVRLQYGYPIFCFQTQLEPMQPTTPTEFAHFFWPLNSHPLVIFLLSLVLLSAAAWVGGDGLSRFRKTQSGMFEDINVIQTATLTLLGLIIGFTFSMAINRYEQRKVLEEAEANAIGTEYVRADLLPAANRAKVRTLLKSYTEKRIEFYITKAGPELNAINQQTRELQNALWAEVSQVAEKQPTPVMALAVSGMNDVLNSQGYSQAAWWNRIPTGAWVLMVIIAIFANLLLGFGARRFDGHRRIFIVFPLVVSISFFLIADIDSPRGGSIRVVPQNLISLMQSFS